MYWSCELFFDSLNQLSLIKLIFTWFNLIFMLGKKLNQKFLKLTHYIKFNNNEKKNL